MPFNPLTLAFTRQWASLEPEFLNHNFKESLFRARIAILAVLLFYGIFGILDYVMVPDKKLIFWAIRYLVVIPLALGVLGFSFWPQFRSWAQPLLFIMCLTGGLGIEVMVILAEPPATYSYYAGIILIFITIHTFLNMRFLWATACSWTIVVFYEITAVWVMDTPAIILINNNIFFISAVLICMLAGGIAHDFSNILSAVIGYTELAMEENDPEERHSQLSQVFKAGQRAKNLTPQVLTSSRQTEQENGPIELGSVVEEALTLLKATLPASVTMLSRLESKRRVIADATQIHRIMVNLFTNAVQSMAHHRGTLDIVLEDIDLDSKYCL